MCGLTNEERKKSEPVVDFYQLVLWLLGVIVHFERSQCFVGSVMMAFFSYIFLNRINERMYHVLDWINILVFGWY